MKSGTIQNIYELTPLQQGMLFHSLYTPDVDVYNIQLDFTLHGHIDIHAFQRAWQQVVARHPILRTGFVWDNLKQPYQVVHESVELNMARHDWCALSAEQQGAALVALAREDKAQSFSLDVPPLMRLNLIQLSALDYRFLWTFHHMIMEGWSAAIVLREVGEIYKGHAQGAQVQLAPALAYSDYIRWLQQLDPLPGEAYWRRTLAGFSEPNHLPMDKAQGDAPPKVAHCTQLRRRLSPEHTQALNRFAKHNRLTLATLSLGAWALLLSRHTRSSDIVFGVVVSGRSTDLAGVDSMVGLCINTLPARVYVDANARLVPWLQTLQREQAELRKYEHSSIVQAQACSDVPHGQPLFETLVAVQNWEGELPQKTWLGEVELHDIRANEGSDYPLALEVTPGPQLTVDLRYDPQRFDEDAVVRMQGHLNTLLEAFVTEPAQCLCELPLLSEEERQQVVSGWNEAVSYEKGACLHERFEAQVARSPEAVALVCDGERLSYAELNRRANRLAHRLRALGVVPERLVGLQLERGVGLVVGILGILKSGGAYLPLDPGYPKERVAFMLADSGVQVVVTETGLAAEFEDLAVTRVRLDEPLSGEETNPEPVSTADDLAYVIYTSGSTGTPKGALITHANVTRLFEATGASFGFDQRDVWTLFHSCAFDFSVWELWGALLNGGRLVVVPYLVSRSPEAFRALLVSERVTVLNQTPSAFRQLMEADQSQTKADLALRYVIFGGEALDLHSLRPWFERYGDERPRLIDMYGITETTVHVTYRPIRRADLDAKQGSVIGLPLPDLQVYILDPNGEPTPIGVPGELYIGGAGVARGYLNRPELTAEKFVADPFSGEEGARLYRSGDRARRLENGDLEFLGRFDDQVKLRGHRIELGEVEAALSRHRAVREAVAMVREDAPGDQRLVGYVVAEEWSDEPVGELTGRLRNDLADELPGYMVPSAFVVLKELPLTANGKLDRRALPAPEYPAVQRAAYVAPRTATEEIVAGIWAEVLGLEQVGVEDNFFELGGHSLLAVSVIERMRRAGLHADVPTLFSSATIAALAAAGQESGVVDVPPNRIPPGCEAITPEMLTLVRLEPEEIGRVVSAVPGGAGNVQDIYPLAPLQEGILFHHLMAREGDPYLVRVLFSFDSRSRVDRYVEALRAVIERYDILRTAVLWEGLPEPVQVVWRRAPLEVEEVGLDPDGGDAEQQMRACVGSRFDRIDVRQAPLLRLFIAHDEANGRWVMLQLFHHLAIDHATLEMMRQEIQAHLLGRAGHVPTPMPFRNYVAQSRLGVPREEHEAFFRKMLGDVDEPTAPFGLTDVHGDGSGIAEAYRPVDAELARRLRERARALGVSAASVCHLAWAQVLARVSGREDVVFGTVLFGRMQGGEETDRALGLFINTLPVRLRVGEDGVEASVRQTHTLLAQLLHHEHATLALAQRCSAVAAPAPLFSGLLNYRHSTPAGQVPMSEPEAWAGVQLLGAEERTNYPLVLSVDDLGEGVGLTAQVQSPIDPARVCAYMHQALEALVASLADDPSAPLRSLDVLPSAERRQVLVEWNDTTTVYPRDRCVHQLFEEQAARRPDAVAVEYEGEELSYGELNRRANQLARYLGRHGVKPETPVGLCVDRSLEMVVGLLGILKAGGAYVPLDPEYPQERLGFMLADTQAPVLLTKQELLSGFPETAARLVCLDSDWQAIAKESHETPISDAIAESLAYVMYTSGSTGRPKGVCVTHRNVDRLVKATNYASFGAEEVFLQFAPISFDAATLELWGPLLNGGRLVVFPAATPSLEQLAEVIEQHQVSTLWLTAGLFHQLVENHLDSLGSVRQLLAGGDVLSVPHVRRVLEQLDGCCLINGYGPTENTTFTTCYPMTDVSALGSAVPIGRPIANTRVYILDAQLQPVPIGVAGELYTGGDGLARGYFNRPELTAEKFVPDHFSEDPAARLYKTGDLARYLPDGSIEFLGRIDHQVKIRGFRIEIGEIETVLSQHPDVQEAVVVVREGPQGEKWLLGYVVSTQETVSPSELRQHLKQTLPEYMVPAIFMKLDALPLNPNGKVDRRALPVPEGSQPQVETDFVAPRSPYEDAVAEIWRDSLGLEQVGIYDNFFDLGGHSLLATKIVSRLKTTFAVDIPLRAFFDSPTIAGVSATLAMTRRGEEPTEKAGIQPVARNSTLPLSFAQERFWVLDQLHANRAVFNESRGFRLRGPFQLDVFREGVQALVDRHEILRTTFASVDGEPYQVVAPTLSVEVPLQNCSGLSKEEQAGMIQQAFLEEERFQFDLAHGPLFRARLLRFAGDNHFLVLNFHHIILDAWSLEVIIKDLVTAYTAGCAGHTVTLTALPIQYADYAHWQRERLEGPIGREQLGFWKTQLAQLPPALPLPTDYARPAVQTFRGAREDLQLSTELLAPLRALNRQEGTTLFMVLLATLQFLLQRLTGTLDILVGSPIAGRDQQELHGLIGCFLNTLVLRTDLSGELTGRHLLRRVREVVLNAYENQDVPFEKILAEVDPARDLSRTPIFQVLLNMHSFDDQGLSLPELSVTQVRSPDINSLFDMTLYFLESADKIYLSLVYNADLFTAGRMTEFMRQFQSILEQMINDPDRPLEAFTLVTPSARSYLPDPRQPLDAEWEGPVWNPLERHALQRGEAIAIASPGETWTYQDLETRSNRLAHNLLEQGVKAQDVVAIYACRSPELVLALLGILKADAAFMILDPSYPSARLLEMLQIARPRGFVHLEQAGPLPEEVDAWAAGVPCRVRLPAFAADETDLEELWGNRLTTAPEVKVKPDDVAYVTFTSGSSGTPKCLQGTHRPLSHFMQWYTQALQLTAADRVTLFSGLAHDPLLRDVFTPLWIGGTLCIPDQEALALGQVGEWMNEQQITLMHLTPPLVDVLTGGRDTSRVSCPSLRYAVFGGDRLRPVHLDCIKQFAPQARCVNGYGTTETPQIVCWHEVPPEFSSNLEQVPIGQGIDGVQVLLLNNAGQQAGIGELGEIYIRTPYLTQGYVNDEALTSARFLPSPFRPEAGDRLYRTGDMGRLSPDGRIEFLGRLDHQVKLRGYRIELGEIEAVLATHPGVHQAVVVREDLPGDQRLVAYLMADSALSSSELRRLARSRLPEYMVPTAWVTMEAFPLMPNRKVDRQALPAPERLGVESEAAYVAPRTPYEEALAGIWAEVLGLERIGIRDNFFDVGGHSLLALRLRASMEKRFKKDIPLVILFQAPTIEQLAEMLDEGFRPTAWTSLVPMQTEGSNPPFFCVPEAGSTVYSLSNLARHLGTKQPFYGLQPVGMDGDRSPHTRIEDMAAHYIKEIKSAQPEGPYLLGGRCFGSEVAFEIAQQLCAQGEEVALLALIGDNFLADWARKGVRTSDSAYSLTHAFRRALYYLLRSSLGDVVRTTLKELNIRFNPRLRYTRRVYKAQLLARANYVRKPYPGRATVFTVHSSLPCTCSASILASLAEGGVDVQKIPRVYDRILDEPHVQVVAAKLIGCINNALDERFTTKHYTRRAPVAQASKKNGDFTRLVSAIDDSPRVTVQSLSPIAPLPSPLPQRESGSEEGGAERLRPRSTDTDASPTDPRRCLDFSLVLPCYNEAPHFVDSIAEIVRALDAAELEYEIILIDDRSTDETAQTIRSYLSGQPKRNIRAYYHDTNLGRGATVAEGIRRANSTYVGFLDIDLETPPQFIPAALDALVSDSADMVLGNRKIVRALQSPLRLLMSSVYRWLVSRLLKTDSLDTEAGFKFFRRDLILPVLDEVQDSHWFWDTEITVVAQAKGLRIYSLPVTYCRDLTKQSSVRPFQDSWRSFASLLAFAKRHRFARHDVTQKETRV